MDEHPVGTILKNAHGIPMRKHAWGWWPAQMTPDEEQVAAFRDRQHMAKIAYGQIASQLGVSRATNVGAYSDGTTYARYIVGQECGALEFIERIDSPTVVRFEIYGEFVVDAAELADTQALRSRLAVQAGEAVGNFGAALCETTEDPAVYFHPEQESAIPPVTHPVSAGKVGQ